MFLMDVSPKHPLEIEKNSELLDMWYGCLSHTHTQKFWIVNVCNTFV